MFDIQTIINNREFFPFLDDEQLEFVQSISTHSRGYFKYRISLAIFLKFYEKEGRSPSNNDLIPLDILTTLSRQLDIPIESIKEFDWEGRTARRFKSSVRAFFGYRKAESRDVKTFINWIKLQILKDGLSIHECHKIADSYFKFHKLEPFKEKELKRHIGSANSAVEKLFFKTISDKLSSSSEEKLDHLIAEPEGDTLPDEEEFNQQNVFTRLKEVTRGASKRHVLQEIEKLEILRQLELPQDFGFSEKIVDKNAQRISFEFPSHIKTHPDQTRWSSLASFCYITSQKTTDTLVNQLRERIRRLRNQAETHTSQYTVKEVKREGGKMTILYNLAISVLETPDGRVKDVVFPKVSQEKLENIVREFHQGKWYQYQVKLKMLDLYRSHARSVVLPILNTLELKSHNPSDVLLLEAVDLIKRYQDSKSPYFPLSENVPINGIISSQWHSMILENSQSDVTHVNRYFYEIAVLETLSIQLSSKNVWVEGAKQYRNPDLDTPTDFYKNQAMYFELLGLTMDADEFIQQLKKRLSKALKLLNANIPSNQQVQLLSKKGKSHISISPFQPKKEPDNLLFLQKEIQERWQGITLLDLLRETDLRVGFSNLFQTVTDHKKMPSFVLQKRLLLCLGALGSNVGIQRVFAANGEINDSYLDYVKRRFITPYNLRNAIAEVVNATIDIRDPKIWGTATTGCACDSKHVSSWDQNLMSQWHPRYRKSGVMIYWHVDQNSLCIYSQLKTCTSSEVASMIEGVLRHSSQMDMNQTYTDTHGQSTIGFAFAFLLGFDLLPRIKRIHKQKLFVPHKNACSLYPNLDLIIHSTPISWKRIREQYTEMVKYTVALKKGTAETDVLLRRFSKNNYTHPTYQALMELGKVIKTIFLCRYLMDESLRQEIQESLNVVERVNGAMNFLFYGKLGAISSNRTEEQEITILSLHLLQVCLVYINTLMIQEVLKDSKWRHQLTENDWRALTPLIHAHINPYGRFELDMNKRLEIPYPQQRRAA